MMNMVCLEASKTPCYTGRSLRQFVEQELGTLPHFVIYAVLEWTLIGLLFLDGFLTFVSIEFSDFFDLQPPCVLCTRIDHILTRNRSRYHYNETVCDDHKKDLSSLAYCQVHRKLSDIKTMCEGCLFSHATDKSGMPSNGDLDKDVGGLQSHWNDSGDGNGGLVYCSCCGEPMKVKPKAGYENSSGNGGNVGNDSEFSSSVPSRILQQIPAPSPCNLELSHIQCKPEITAREEDDTTVLPAPTVSKEELKPIATPRQSDPDNSLSDFLRTPSFAKGNKFFNTSDSSAASTPRFANRMPRKSLLEKVELASDPIDAIIGNETDIETILNRLKNQVRSDKKSLVALYMELDEERSAAAVAANNAMAMITRLQAEKSALRMEALQYQRMMEEQAEYDNEDIQVLKDFLSKKEDEIKELESEIEIYKDRYGAPCVARGNKFERSQSSASTIENGSSRFGIGAYDVEMEVDDHVFNKDGSEVFYGVGETSGQKFDDADCEYENHMGEDYVDESKIEEGEDFKSQYDNDTATTLSSDIPHTDNDDYEHREEDDAECAHNAHDNEKYYSLRPMS